MPHRVSIPKWSILNKYTYEHEMDSAGYIYMYICVYVCMHVAIRKIS